MVASLMPKCVRAVANARSLPCWRTVWPRAFAQLHLGGFSSDVVAVQHTRCCAQLSDNQLREARSAGDVSVSMAVTGAPRVSEEELAQVLNSIEDDGQEIVRLALASETRQTGQSSKVCELSLVLSDDTYMRSLNLEWRGKDATTDVLSFEFPSDEFDVDLPVRLLGDVVISLEQADRQARERRDGALYGGVYTLRDEVRVLLIHGVLHLIGFDHELGPAASAAMAAEEARIIAALGWRGAGLLEASGHPLSMDAGGAAGPSSSHVDDSDASSSSDFSGGDVRFMSDIEVVCLDMDGTLLNSESRFSGATVDALRRHLNHPDRTVMVATGKCRPAAIAACRLAGLAGPGLLVDETGPGIFLQGLAVYGPSGELLPGGSHLPASVVRTCFEYAASADVPCVAFLGDTCVTLRLTDELRELHTRYFEPLAAVAPSVEDIVSGPPVKKIILMSSEERISDEVIPYVEECLQDTATDLTQAVPTMLEVLPAGASKWSGLLEYLRCTGQSPESVMAIGDGMNDYEILSNVGLSVAMANAVDDLIEIADYVTDSNDEDGAANALNKFL